MNRHFSLDKRLEDDTKFITALKICDLRLLNDSRWPWLVLVPRIDKAVELHELNRAIQHAIFAEVMDVSKALQFIFPTGKINTGFLGNIVRQLHIHIIARHEGDNNWPGPVWGVCGKTAYDEVALTSLIGKVKKILADGSHI